MHALVELQKRALNNWPRTLALGSEFTRSNAVAVP